jgi:hypothetical protein
MLGEIVNQGKGIAPFPVVAFRPDLSPGNGVDQFGGDTDACPATQHAACQHVVGLRCRMYRRHVVGSRAQFRSRAAGDNLNAAAAGKSRCEIVRERFDEIRRPGIATSGHETHDRDERITPRNDFPGRFAAIR